MPFTATGLPGVEIFEPKVFEDHRGYFYESYNQKAFEDAGINSRFVQDNQSRSIKGVLRGLHYQNPPYAQAKLIRVLSGRIYDVAVDIRKGSPAFGRWEGVELSAENRRQLFIPKGFAHGFIVLSDTAEIFYKCDELYNVKSEGGICYNDPAIGIDWHLSDKQFLLSEKDRTLPLLEKAANDFIFGVNS
jgi:dTDP-4-dehydrorhamnose 3,5-epimerase